MSNTIGLVIWMGVLIAIFCTLYMIKRRSAIYPFALLGKIADRFIERSREDRINMIMRRYEELSKKPRIVTSALPLIIVMLLGIILYLNIIYFVAIGSGSMAPSFNKGDLVLMQNLFVNPQEGDIIKFETAYVVHPVVHRIYSIEDGIYRTKGDANPRVDPWVVRRNEIEGQAILLNEKPIIIENLGYYFIEDPANPIYVTKYGGEYGLIKSLVQMVKSSGLLLFIIMIALYLYMTLEEFKVKSV
ncbi:MAG: signal peptidase I [Methanocellales archaeon]|nr:signal peptidase I [Methanocellales archaeon]